MGIEVEGQVIAVLPSTSFRVRLDHHSHEVLAHLSGKLRKNFIKIGVGDRVKLEMDPSDLTQARICYRLKEVSAPAEPPKRSFGPRHNTTRKHNPPAARL
ncbi:MAG: translation initiation factor IF-1 [Opitutales bacterium]|nr:translation initiation factor IF-1 [Opitutales bacterium]